MLVWQMSVLFPLSFIFLRGQGIKIFSLVSKECKNEDFLVPLIKHSQEETRLTSIVKILSIMISRINLPW